MRRVIRTVARDLSIAGHPFFRGGAFRFSAAAASTAIILAFLQPDAALAACTFAPTAGDDTFTCDSGISPGGLTDPGGSNTLLFPASGTGTLNGNVVFGVGTDTILMRSGTITGFVDQGDGADLFEISGGTVLGNVQQGVGVASGIDTFRMSGGQIQSLNQGGGLDIFVMSGGRIVDFFDDGDNAVMTGGRIGRVNMLLDDNFFDMSGGTIDRNLVAGFGNDTIILSNGTIGGNISVSGGTDRVTVTGGSVGGNVLMSLGTDSFSWNGGGVIYGRVDLGEDADTAVLKDLTNSHVGAAPLVDGNLGADSLTLDNVSMDRVSRLARWETIAAGRDTDLSFDGSPLVLGDAGTGTGSLSVDATSTLYGGGVNAAVTAFTPGMLVNLANAGRIDLTNGGAVGDTFRIDGNYTGSNGLLFLNTVLAGDGSPSDRLVISGGVATGSTFVDVVNAGGAGAATAANGILVVEALNGGTTAAGSFALSGRVAAGAYEYLLFRGGSGGADNWYLRSTMATAQPEPGPSPVTVSPEPVPVAPETTPAPPPSGIAPVPVPTVGDPVTPPVDPTPALLVTDPAPVAPPAPPAAGAPSPPPLVTAAALVDNPADLLPLPNPDRLAGGAMPLYRGEVPVYATVSPVAHQLALATLGTFHERRGAQAGMRSTGFLPAAWGRVFGQRTQTSWGGTLTPSLDGAMFGVQAGFDLLGWESASDHQDRVGVFFSYSRMTGDVNSPTIGGLLATFGTIAADGTSFGASWTHVGPGGWYLDGVAMATLIGGDAASTAGERIGIRGTGVALSLEGGYSIALTPEWTLEPQAQLIWHHLSLNNRADSFATIGFAPDDSTTGRVGFRLQGEFAAGAATYQPYFKANLWHEFAGEDLTAFDGAPVFTRRGGTSLEIGGGIVARLTESVSIHATADYTTSLGGHKKRILEGNVGLSVKW